MWYWLSIEACATIYTPAFLIVPLIHVSQFQSVGSFSITRPNLPINRLTQPDSTLRSFSRPCTPQVMQMSSVIVDTGIIFLCILVSTFGFIAHLADYMCPSHTRQS